MDGLDNADQDPSDGALSPDRLEFLWRVRDSTESGIRFADTKAGAILGVALALTGLTFNVLTQKGASVLAGTTSDGIVIGAWATAATFLLTLWTTLQTIRPRRGPAAGVHGHLYSGDIARGSATAFRNALRRLDEIDVMEELIRDVWQLSTISIRKYTWVDWSVKAMAANTACGIFVLILIATGLQGEVARTRPGQSEAGIVSARPESVDSASGLPASSSRGLASQRGAAENELALGTKSRHQAR